MSSRNKKSRSPNAAAESSGPPASGEVEYLYGGIEFNEVDLAAACWEAAVGLLRVRRKAFAAYAKEYGDEVDEQALLESDLPLMADLLEVLRSKAASIASEIIRGENQIRR